MRAKSDGVIRLPYGRENDDPQVCDDPITHWAALPTLPGTTVHHLMGEEAKTARAKALGEEVQ
nr:hypothetical protein [Microbispora rosea]